MRIAIGVEGGGSLIRAVVVDERGTELGRGDSRGAVVREDAPGVAATAVAEAVHGAAASAGVSLPAAALWAGLAGAGRDAARQAAAGELHRLGLATHVHVGSDVDAACQDAFAERAGILVIAGTGSIAWGRNERGDEARVGGWGHLLGDEGSGYSIGLGALRAVARSQDVRGPGTALAVAVLEALALDRVDALIPWAASASKADVASLVPIVVRVAEAGDPVARALIEGALSELESHVTAVLTRLGPWSTPPEVVLWGGLLVGGPLGTSLRERLARHHVRVANRVLDPALGAARLALASLLA